MRSLVVLFILLSACTQNEPIIIQGPKGDAGQSITGPQGPTGSTGATGQDGQSIVGPQGPQGDPGAPGTVVTWVQFCQGTTTYPSTYIEGGFCINNNLYAVYSANNGFLVYLPPGNYSSNAINSSCSFTVLPNCQIQ